MKEWKTAAIGTMILLVLGIAGYSLYTVRAYLPAVGFVVLVAVLVGIVAGIALAITYGILHVQQKAARWQAHPITEYGLVLARAQRLVEIAPYRVRGIEEQAWQGDDEDIIDATLEDEPALLPAATPPAYRPFSELLTAGIVQQAIEQGKMILGYLPDGTLRYGSWLDLYSCLIGGVSGSGKSTTVRFLLFQAAMAGARFLFVDPHIGDKEESLAAQFRAFPAIHQLPPCDDTPAQVARRIKWLGKELDTRKKTGRKTPFLILVVDELNALFFQPDLKVELAKLLLRIGREGRKFGIFFMGIGQRFSQQDLGGAPYGAAIREAMASDLAHRFTSEEQAKKFIGSRNGPRCLELPTGHYLFRDTAGGLTEMITPDTRANDGDAIARVLGYGHDLATSEGTSETAFRDLGDVPADVGEKPVDAAHEPMTEPLSIQAYRVLELLREKRGQNEIIEEVWGYKSSDGRPYRAAVEEYRATLALLACRIGA